MADTRRASGMKRGDTWQEVCGTPDIIELDEGGDPIEEPRPPAPQGVGWCGTKPVPGPPEEADDLEE
jgi:hypothetical protein